MRHTNLRRVGQDQNRRKLALQTMNTGPKQYAVSTLPPVLSTVALQTNACRRGEREYRCRLPFARTCDRRSLEQHKHSVIQACLLGKSAKAQTSEGIRLIRLQVRDEDLVSLRLRWHVAL